MTLQEEKIQDDPIRGTPEIGRRGHLLHRLPACLRAGQVSGMVLTVPKVRLSEMPRLITSTARGSMLLWFGKWARGTVLDDQGG